MLFIIEQSYFGFVNCLYFCLFWGFPGDSAGKESTCNARDLEKGMATHSSILAWIIPRTEQSMGSQRVGHDWATFTLSHPCSPKNLQRTNYKYLLCLLHLIPILVFIQLSWCIILTDHQGQQLRNAKCTKKLYAYSTIKHWH